MNTELKTGDIVRLINQGDLPPIDLSRTRDQIIYLDTSEKNLYEVKNINGDKVDIHPLNKISLYSFSSVHKTHCVLDTPLEDRSEYFFHIDRLSTIRIFYLDKKNLESTPCATIDRHCPIPALQEAIQKLQDIQVSEPSRED